MAEKANSLSHTKWMCKYHIVFTPKYRRKVIYNQYRKSLGEIFRRLCSYKGVEIIEGHLMLDHVHMLVSIPPRISISNFMWYWKWKSALMMFDKHANLKYKWNENIFIEKDTLCVFFCYVTFSPSRSVGAWQINHPLCWCASNVIPTKLPSRYNKGVQANCKAKGEKYGIKGT